jgi:polyhydroxybutyrate depolymerase
MEGNARSDKSMPQRPATADADSAAAKVELATPGIHIQSIITGDGRVRRWFTVYTPKRRMDSPALVFALHGAHGGMRNMIKSREDLRNLADKRGFVVVFPNGQNPPTHKTGQSFWNAGFCCGEMDPQIDDVRFISEVAVRLTMLMSIDRQHIHIIGFSNGGMLTQRIAAERADLFASVASMGAVPGYFQRPGGAKKVYPVKSPIPVLLMHGTNDNTIPFAGGTMTVGDNNNALSLSYAQTLEHWSDANRCKQPDVRETQSDLGRSLQITTYSGCAADVVGIAVQGFGHKWIDADNADFDGTLRAIEFFEANPKRLR